MLRPGGKILIGDWVVEEGQTRSGCHRFTAREIRQMLEATGFEGIEIEEVEPGLVLMVGGKGWEHDFHV